MKKNGFKQNNHRLHRFCRFLAERAFLTFLILLLLSLLLGGLLFYKYSFLTAKAEPADIHQASRFKEEVYQGVVDEWQSREERFEAADTKEYLDAFR